MRPIKMIQARVVEVVPYAPPVPFDPSEVSPAPSLKDESAPKQTRRRISFRKEMGYWIVGIAFVTCVMMAILTSPKLNLLNRMREITRTRQWYEGTWYGKANSLMFYQGSRGFCEINLPGKKDVQELKNIECEGLMCLFTFKNDNGQQRYLSVPLQYVLLQDSKDPNKATFFRLDAGYRYSFSRRSNYLGEIGYVPVVPDKQHTQLETLYRQKGN